MDSSKMQGTPHDDYNLMKTYEGKANGYNVPKYGWRIALSHKFACQPTVWAFPPLSQVPSLIGLSVRYLLWYRELHQKNKKPCMDFFNQSPLHQIYGVPLGGIGAGTINRGWKGDFCKWQLQPGVYTQDSPLADQFIVTIRKNGKTTLQQVLNPKSPNGKSLSRWNWAYCGSYAYYHGLYPRSWTVYSLPGQDIVLTCRQISPVFPNDYKDTSMPAAVFVWTIENNRKDNVEVSITMCMENGIGNEKIQSSTEGLYNTSFSSQLHTTPVKGVTMHNISYPNMPYTMSVAASEKVHETTPLPQLHLEAGVSVSHCVSFDPAKDGAEVWNPLLTSGSFDLSEDVSHVTKKGESIACAVSCKCQVEAKSLNQVEFALSWDMPQIHFGDSQKYYKRRYVRWFGSDGKAGPDLCDYSLNNYKFWEEKIESWQRPILSNKELPHWYKSALFNELYYVTDGGTVWLEGDDAEQSEKLISNGVASLSNESNEEFFKVSSKISSNTEEEIRNCKHIKEYGRFAYLEGQEYKMYNTYDVHFYASFALAHLWPELEISLQYDMAASILHSNPEPKKYLMDGISAPTKTPNCVPHDVGCPDDEPWLSVNAYFVHDTSEWRDLNPKFILQVYRDYHQLKDKEFLTTLWPILQLVAEHSLKHDEDGDGLIENSGAADQTFDGWCVEGPSAYCGGLWLAALRCMVEAASVLGEKDEEKRFADILEKAKEAYNSRLWNGKYYDYDSSRHLRSSSVMADQCAGQWYLYDVGIKDVLPEENVSSALKTIFDLNVKKFADGYHGAVNGMRPDGTVDKCSVQSDEVWTGVAYGLAATMIHKGMIEEGFETARGIYRTCWERYGMSYQTPEAFRESNTYRSLAYMRPLSIWGVQRALESTELCNRSEKA